MRKLLVICCTPLFLFAQEKENNHTVEWNSNFLFESNGLNKSFLNTMLYGGHISDEIKTASQLYRLSISFVWRLSSTDFLG